MGVEFLLVLGLLLAVSAMVPAMAHADDDRPDPEEEKRIKLENQEYDRRAIEQSRRLTREAQQRAAIEKQTAADRLQGLEDASEKTANFSQQLTEAGQQKAASITVTPKLETGDIEKTLYEAVVGTLERAGADGAKKMSTFIEEAFGPTMARTIKDNWELGLAGAGALVAAKKGRGALKARKVRRTRRADEAAYRARNPAASADEAAEAVDRRARNARQDKKPGLFGKGSKSRDFAGKGLAGAAGYGLAKSQGLKSLINMFGQLGLELNDATAKVRRFTNLTRDEDTFGALVDNIYDTNTAWRAHGLEVQQIQDINIELIEGFRGFSKMQPRVQKDIVNTSAMMAILGVDAKTGAKNMEIMGNAMGLTGKQSTNLTKDIAGTADALNMSLPSVMQQFAGMEDKLVQFGVNSATAMKELMVVSKNTNIPMNDLLGTLDNFDTFDEAANAAGNLNALLGGEFIDDIALMNASLEGDTLGVMTMVQDALANSAVGWDDMNAAQKKAISETTGIGMGNLARIARGDLTADMATATDVTATEKRVKELATQGRGIVENMEVSMKGAETVVTTGKVLDQRVPGGKSPQEKMEATQQKFAKLPAGKNDITEAIRLMGVVTETTMKRLDATMKMLTGGIKLDEGTVKKLTDSMSAEKSLKVVNGRLVLEEDLSGRTSG
jgi:hypothetical protein